LFERLNSCAYSFIVYCMCTFFCPVSPSRCPGKPLLCRMTDWLSAPGSDRHLCARTAPPEGGTQQAVHCLVITQVFVTFKACINKNWLRGSAPTPSHTWQRSSHSDGCACAISNQNKSAHRPQGTTLVSRCTGEHNVKFWNNACFISLFFIGISILILQRFKLFTFYMCRSLN